MTKSGKKLLVIVTALICLNISIISVYAEALIPTPIPDWTIKFRHDFELPPYACYQINSAVNNNFCVNVKSNSSHDGTNIQLYKADRTSACEWRIELYCTRYGYGEPEKLYRIINYNSGKALDVKAGKAANKTNVQLYRWNGTSAQLWKIRYNKDGSVTFLSALKGRYALDLAGGRVKNGQNIQLYQDNGTKAQRWYIEPRTIDDECDYVRFQKIGLHQYVLKKGQQKKYFTNLTGKLYYSSSNGNVASVDANGVIRAKNKGKATITVRNGKQTAKLVVCVK